MEGLTFRYGGPGARAILHQLDLSFDASGITVITGASGCGKSTLLFLVAGLSSLQSGSLQGRITIDGQDPARLVPHLRCQMVGMMFQHPDLQFCMDTAERELAFCLENIGVPPEQMDIRIDEAISFCGIAHLKERTLISLSGGEKQKVMLACLIALRPRWLLLDEPFANIDDASAGEIVEKIHQMHKQYGTGIIAVDHRVAHWTTIADRWVEMDHRGQVSQVDLPSLFQKSSVYMTTEDGRCQSVDGLSPLANEQCQLTHETCPSMDDVKGADIGAAYKAREDKSFSAQPLLSLRNLQLSYGEAWILRSISVSFYPGRLYAILGASGSGKSSLLGVMGGILPSEKRKKGFRLTFWRTEKEKVIVKTHHLNIGMITQSPQDQFLAVDVQGEILLSLRKRFSSSSAREQEAERILREIGLWPYRNFSPYRLSQGQQRRLGVAAVLACSSDLLLADEPTYGQDPRNAVRLMEALQEQVKSQGSTLIFTTHDRWLAERYADAIYEMRDGQLCLLAERRAL